MSKKDKVASKNTINKHNHNDRRHGQAYHSLSAAHGDEDTLAMTDEQVTESLQLVASKVDLLKLYDVASMPILRGVDSSLTAKANEQLLSLYHNQSERTRQLYLASSNVRPIYPVCNLKHQFVEYQQYQLSHELDKRAHLDTHLITRLWQQLHIVDELIMELVQHMPVHEPVGWQINSQSRNYLHLPTAGKLRYETAVADQSSINSYVLGHFGVMSYTYDKSYFIGHVLGYLFVCYYFAHLSISYGVSPLAKSKVSDYEYKSLTTPYLVRLLQTLDGESKKRVYQLAVICAKLSTYATDKRIEKLLIAEVNDFSKKEQKINIERWLDEGVMPLSVFNQESD